jgi:sortase A
MAGESHAGLHNGAILIGCLLLLASIAGLYLESTGAWGPGGVFSAPPDPPAQILALVTATPRADPLAPPMLALPMLAPSATPFQAQLPTLLPLLPLPPLPPLPPNSLAGQGDEGGAVEPAGVVRPAGVGEHASAPAAPEPFFPDWIHIPAIGVDAPVVPSGYALVGLDGQTFQQWQAPEMYAAGWQFSSVALGQPGNTVLSGHHNVHGAVFGSLVRLPVGEQIEMFSRGERFVYEVTNSMILLEEGQPLRVRFENARWLLPSEDERLTLVTCWPDNANSHRLIVVARRVQ